jgi:hypothetical protein
MAKRGGNTFLLVAVGLGYLAYTLLKPKRAAGPATHQNGTVGGAVLGSPNQVVYAEPGIPFNYNATFPVGV